MRPMIMIFIIFFAENSIGRVLFHEEESTPSLLRSRFINAALNLDESWNVFVSARNTHLLGKIFITVPSILINDWDTLAKAMSEIEAGKLIVILDGNADDENFYDLERLRGVETRHSVSVICYDAAACNSEVYLEKITESTNNPMLHYLVVDEEGSVVRIYERTKTAEGNCGVPRLVRLSYNSTGPWMDNETFSMLPMNFNKCPIRLATWYLPSKSWPCETGDSNHFCGFEGEIVKNFIDKINATPVTTVTKNGREVTDLVATKRADLGYGNLHVDTNRTFIYSSWYMYIKATIIVSHLASGSGASMLLTMALPLNREVWIGFALAITSILILGRLIPYFRGLSALQQFGTLFGIAVPIHPRQIPQRIYFFSIIMFSFWYSQLYLVNLTKIYSSVPQLHIVRTLEELEELGLKIYGNDGGKQMLNEFGYARIAENNYEVRPRQALRCRIVLLMRYNSSIRNNAEIERKWTVICKSVELFQVVDIRTHVIKIVEILMGRSRDSAYVEIDVEWISSWKNIEVIEQMVELFSLGIMTPNSSTFMPVINRVSLSMLESGIRDKLSVSKLTGKRAVIFSWLYGRGSSISDIKTREPMKLSLKDLRGVFLLNMGGLSLSILIFIIELGISYFKVELSTKRRVRSPPIWLRQKPRLSQSASCFR